MKDSHYLTKGSFTTRYNIPIPFECDYYMYHYGAIIGFRMLYSEFWYKSTEGILSKGKYYDIIAIANKDFLNNVYLPLKSIQPDPVDSDARTESKSNKPVNFITDCNIGDLVKTRAGVMPYRSGEKGVITEISIRSNYVGVKWPMRSGSFIYNIGMMSELIFE